MKYRSIWKFMIVLASIAIVSIAAADSPKKTLLYSDDFLDISGGTLVSPLSLSVSPDGRAVLYSTLTIDVKPTAKSEAKIYSIDSSGMGGYPRVVAEGKDAMWSPDGEKIVYDGTEEGLLSYTDPKTGLDTSFDLDIYVMDASGNKNAYPMQGNQINPRWSPDGEKIAYMGSRFGSTIIYVMDADGTNISTLLDDPLVQSTPLWSPDGTRIAFSSNRTGNPEIYTMNINGTELTQLTNNMIDDRIKDWSLDGEKILFESGDFLCTMNPDGTEKEILVDVRSTMGAAFSPNRDAIYYTVLGGEEDDPNFWGIYKLEL